MNQYCFGVDIGGTSVKMGLFDTDGNLLDKWEIPTRKEEGGGHILPDIAASILGKLTESGIDKNNCVGVGVGVPGPVSREGIVYTCVNLGWNMVDVVNELSNLVGMSVKAGNDANVAALGESWKGGGKGYGNLVLATLGTGVGGGIIIDGKILTGSKGAGGEIGHIHVEDREETACNCGNKGCLEQYASATGIVRLAGRILASTDKPSALRGGEVSAKTVFDAVKDGDELALEVAEKFGEYLGKAFATTAGICNPEIFVIGGGVSKAGPILIEYIRKYYLPVVFSENRDAKFALATLENDAGIYGAAKLVLES